MTAVLSIDDHAEYWRSRSERAGELCFVALGDSLAQGYGASTPDRGYVGQLAELVGERCGGSVRVVNLGVCGATVRELVAEQLPALAQLQPDVVTLCIGANDAGVTAPAAFRATLATVCEALPAGAFVADVPDFQGGHASDRARALSAICREVVHARTDLRPVALEAATAEMTVEEFSDVFAHPDDTGYRRYTSAFWSAMAPTLEPASAEIGHRNQ